MDCDALVAGTRGSIAPAVNGSIEERDAVRFAAARAQAGPVLRELLAAMERGDPTEVERVAASASRAVALLWGAAGLIIDSLL